MRSFFDKFLAGVDSIAKAERSNASASLVLEQKDEARDIVISLDIIHK